MAIISKSVKITPQSSAPGSPTAGQIYYDTEDDIAYMWNGSAWQALIAAPVFAATGGTLDTSVSGYRIHIFTSGSTTFTPGSSGDVDYLIVAGGGSAGGRHHAGGAGAGGVRQLTISDFPAATYSITVGGCGAASAASNVDGSMGGNSGVGSTTTGGTYVATGGGEGAGYGESGTGPGGNGGSGGGGNGGGANGAAGTGNEGGYSPVEGYAGDAHDPSGNSSTYHAGGGGCGAG